MSQPSRKDKFDDEQLLRTALAVELEDAKKNLAQLKLDKPKPPHNGPFGLNVDYCIRNFLKEMDSIDSRLQKLESEQPRGWNLCKIIWKLEIFSAIFVTPNYLKKQKTTMISIQIWYENFVVPPFSANLMAIVSLSALSLMDVVQPLADQCPSLYLW